MATTRRTPHVLAGTLGEIFVDTYSGGGTGRPVILAIHGFKGFKDWGFWPPFAERAARMGFAVVAYNASGSGVDASGEPTLPERFAENTYSAELRDAEIVLGAIRDGSLGIDAASAIGVVGHSRGGAIAVLLTASHDEVDGLVTWAAISSVDRWTDAEKGVWREQGSLPVVNARTGQVIDLSTDILDDVEANAVELDVMRAAAKLTAPWLIVHGADDESVRARDAHQLHSAARGAELRIIGGTGHTFGSVHPWAGCPGATEMLFEATLDFFTRHL